MALPPPPKTVGSSLPAGIGGGDVHLLLLEYRPRMRCLSSTCLVSVGVQPLAKGFGMSSCLDRMWGPRGYVGQVR